MRGSVCRMRCAASTSERIQESVRPAIAMPSNALAMPNVSSNAYDIPRAPAPPVSTRVPSMSKRMSVVTRSAFAADVPCAGPFRRRLFFKADALAFVQLVEAALNRTAVKEPFLAAVVANESESSVAHESLDRTARHPSLLGRACPGLGYQVSFQYRCGVFAGFLRPSL